MKVMFKSLEIVVSAEDSGVSRETKLYQQAIQELQDQLDIDPRNWENRLTLAACYYSVYQLPSAQRAFQYVFEHTNDGDLQRKALEGLRATNAKLQHCPVMPSVTKPIPPHSWEQTLGWM